METTNNNTTFKNVLMVMAAIAVILLLWSFTKDWIKPRVVKALGGYTEAEVKMTTDTLSIKYNDIYTKYKQLKIDALIIPEPEYITEYEYIERPNSNESSTTGKNPSENVIVSSIKRYQTAVNDTILDGIITSVIDIQNCKLVEQSFLYTPKIPYIREKIVTIVETKETILSDTPKAYIGAGLQVNTLNQITPKVMYLTKGKWMYEGGYTKSIDNINPDAFVIGVSKFF